MATCWRVTRVWSAMAFGLRYEKCDRANIKKVLC